MFQSQLVGGAGVVVAASTSTGLLDGSSQDTVIVTASASTGLLDRGAYGYEEAVLRVVVTALTTAGLLKGFGDTGLVRRHEVSQLPIVIVIRGHECLSYDV